VRRWLIALCAATLAGCRGGSSAQPATTGGTTASGGRTAPERAEPAARLPHGWTLVVDRPAGFSFGVPRGWRAHRVPGCELVRSADKALAVSVSYDRGAQARTLNLRCYASSTAHALRGYRNLHRAGSPRARAAPSRRR
jgi:hypothetical protein